jgi:hypothetical protein
MEPGEISLTSKEFKDLKENKDHKVNKDHKESPEIPAGD